MIVLDEFEYAAKSYVPEIAIETLGIDDEVSGWELPFIRIVAVYTAPTGLVLVSGEPRGFSGS